MNEFGPCPDRLVGSIKELAVNTLRISCENRNLKALVCSEEAGIVQISFVIPVMWTGGSCFCFRGLGFLLRSRGLWRRAPGTASLVLGVGWPYRAGGHVRPTV